MEVGCKSGRPSLLEIQVSSVFLILVRTLEMPPYHLINVHFVGVSQTDLHFTSTSRVITFILVVHFNSGGLAKRTINHLHSHHRVIPKTRDCHADWWGCIA